jgi:GNAT superfamily N-acetyltransferase
MQGGSCTANWCHHLFSDHALMPDDFKTDWPQDRLASGFYREILPLSERQACSTPRKSLLDGIPPASASFTLSADRLSDGDDLVSYDITALAHLAGDDRPAAYAEFDILLGRPGRKLDNTKFIDACHSLHDSLGEMASAILSASIQEIHDILSNGSMVHLARLEVRADCAGYGLGRRLLRAMVSRIAYERQARLFVTKPFPLQFEQCSPDSNAPDYPAFQAAFHIARDRLLALYRDTLAAQEVPGLDGYVLSAMPGHQLAVDQYGWSIEDATVSRGSR